MKCLESKTIPILSEVVAFMDINRNMDILYNQGAESWHVKLWLQIINNTEVTKLANFGTVMYSRHTDFNEIIVNNVSRAGNTYGCLIPFSWLLFETIEDLMMKNVERRELTGNFLF